MKLHSIIGPKDTIWKHLKSGGILLVAILALRYSGLMGGLSYVTQSAAMHTGLLDAKIEIAKEKESFDYGFRIKDLTGSPVNFDQFKGKVVFINIWATWCGPCRAEMPTIQSLFETIDSPNIAFVILSIDRERDKGKMISYLKEKQFSFPVFQPAGPLPEMMQVSSIPTTFIIAKDGRIASREVGTTNFNTPKFRKFLAKLASE